MLQPAPASAVCAGHPEAPAAWICARCGSFFCRACERRTRPDAVPMCPGCWALRTRQVGPSLPARPSTALQTTALVVGAFALLPLPAVQLAGAVLGILAIVKASAPAQRRVRWRPILGLALVGVGLVIDVLVYAVLD